jgi:hypothetical protein
MKRQCIEWDIIFAHHSLDKELISGTYNLIKKIKHQRTNNPIKKRTNKKNSSQAQIHEELSNFLNHKGNIYQIDTDPISSKSEWLSLRKQTTNAGQ